MPIFRNSHSGFGKYWEFQQGHTHALNMNIFLIYFTVWLIFIVAALLLVREPNSENCLDLIFAAPPCEKVIIVPETNHITSAIRKFLLDMLSPGKFQNIGILT